MAKILVTGAKGMLGQDLCPILQDEGYEVIETDIDNLEVTDFNMVNRVLQQENPDIVVHCAAYTNVDKAEDNVETARLINTKGTENLAKICGNKDILLVYISTDYVFSGEKAEPYLPTDKTNPLNIYGLTKSEGEEAVRKYCKKYYIVRTSWLYGIHGKNFVETMISFANKPEIKVVDDQIGSPTWTVELSGGIVKLLDGVEYGIYHICGTGQTSWYGFAKKIFELLNKEVNLQPCKTEEFVQIAKRPHYSVMDNNGLCRRWELALRDYLNLRITEEEL